MSAPSVSVGEHLRHWRQRRRMSQLDLACEVEMSTRHLSFVETGRSAPSRQMLMRLAERLEVPLRERNNWLLAAGFAPMFAARPLDDPALRPARTAIDTLLEAHMPNPALAIDGRWNVLAANRAVGALTEGAASWLTAPPVNALRLSLHPQGMAPRIENLAEWRDHVLFRLRRQLSATADPGLADLMRELETYPCGEPLELDSPDAIAIPLLLRTRFGSIALLSTTMVFGTPLDVTLSEMAIETFMPADSGTAAILRRLADPA